MKIAPVTSSPTPTVDMAGNPAPSRVDSVRSMRMKTLVTPHGVQDLPEELRPQALAPNQQLPLSVSDEQPAAVSEATQPLSPQLALLAKQRRALQVKERELLDREKALKAQGDVQRIDVAQLKSEPLKVLLDHGVTYEQLTDAIISGGNGGGASEINSLKAEIAALKEGIDQKFVEKDTLAEQQVLAEMKRQASRLVQASDQYELVRETRSVPMVMQLIERTYRESGEVLDVPEALRLVEDELFKDHQRIAKIKKMQELFAPKVQEHPQPQPQQRTVGMRTISNRDTATVPLTARQRALAAFYGTLKKG